MQENNFENGIRRQVDEFNLRPGDGVWWKVERELRRKKRRRVVIFFSFLAGMALLGYTGYQWTNSQSASKLAIQSGNIDTGNNKIVNTSTDNNNTTASATTNNDRVTDQPGNLTIPAQKAATPVTGTSTNSSAVAVQGTTEKIPVKKQNPAGRDHTAVLMTPVGSRSLKQKYPGHNDQAHRSLINDENKHATMNDSNDNGVDTRLAHSEKKDENKNTSREPATTKRQEPHDNPSEINTPLPASPATNTDTISAIAKEARPVSDSAGTIATADLLLKDSVDNNAGAVPIKISPRKLRWSIEGGLGSTAMRNNALSLLKVSDNLSLSAPVFAGRPSNAVTAFTYPPSEVTKGLAYHLGAAAWWRFTKRSSASIGLRYSYFSNHIRIGDKNDSGVVFPNPLGNVIKNNVSYAAASKYNYTNRFHFLEMPLAYQLQINKGKRTPLTVNVHASLAYLVSTNALIYDASNGGMYYADPSAFTKLHVMTGSGLSLGLRNKKGREAFSIGPDFTLDLSRQMRSAKYNSKYFMSAGAHINWFLPVK